MGLQKSLLETLEDDSLSGLEREQKITKLLQYRPAWAEAQIHSKDPNIYQGTSETALSTPFYDYYQILKDLDDTESLADLGAGHCKGSLLSEAIGKSGKCDSYEVSIERLKGARRTAHQLGLSSDSIRELDLLRDELPIAQCYFIYLPLGELIYRPIQRLLKAKRKARFYVVESHGDLIDFFSSMPKWFTLIKVLPSEGQRHRKGIYVYEFGPCSIEMMDPNSSGFIYTFVSEYSEDREVLLKKESGQQAVKMKELLPLWYNGQMCFECLSLKRIVDFQNVLIVGL